MRLGLALLGCFLLVACVPGKTLGPLAAAPKATLTAIQVYLNETDNYTESLASSTALVKTRLADEQKDASLFVDKFWRDSLAGALRQIHSDYSTLSLTPLPQGTEDYHNAVMAAEAHTDKAALLLLEWLDNKDDGKLKQAQQEFDISAQGLAEAQKILDGLQK